MTEFFLTPKSPSVGLGGPVTGMFEDHSRYTTCLIFPVLTLGQCKFFFNQCNEDLIGKTSPILSILEETRVVPTSSVIASDLTQKLSLNSSILQYTIIVSNSDVITSEPTIAYLKSIISVSEAYTEPPLARKYFINTEDWNSVLARIAKLDSDRAAMTPLLSNLHNQCLSIQQYFILFDKNINDLKTGVKASIIESSESVKR